MFSPTARISFPTLRRPSKSSIFAEAYKGLDYAEVEARILAQMEFFG